MKVYDAAHIKNIAIVGHGGDGKTTLAEAFLANAGLIERRGRVEDGNTTAARFLLRQRWRPSSGGMSS